MNFFRTKLNIIAQRGDTFLKSIHLPKRFQGTVVEKWGKYWENLVRDYSDVVRGTIKECQTKPQKAIFYCCLGALAATAAKKNPSDAAAFREHLIQWKNEFSLVGVPVRNPTSEKHLKYLEGLYNSELIRTFSFGLFTIVWMHDFSDNLGLYMAKCEFLQPQFLTFHTRILDVGFWEKFWILDQKMKDFDVNPEEWEK